MGKPGLHAGDTASSSPGLRLLAGPPTSQQWARVWGAVGFCLGRGQPRVGPEVCLPSAECPRALWLRLRAGQGTGPTRHLGLRLPRRGAGDKGRVGPLASGVGRFPGSVFPGHIAGAHPASRAGGLVLAVVVRGVETPPSPAPPPHPDPCLPRPRMCVCVSACVCV